MRPEEIANFNVLIAVCLQVKSADKGSLSPALYQSHVRVPIAMSRHFALQF